MQAQTMEKQKLNTDTMERLAEAFPINDKKSYLAVKRLFDVVFSLCALLVLAIPMLLLALLIKLESPGAAIYKQERLGKGGKPFMMYKFRSMRVDAEKNGPQWAKVNDERCTRIGRFIRVTHIDELPQLWNVLMGDMSVVGPRPEREFFYQRFEQDIPDFRVRLLVAQGLTCIGQVNGCYDLTPQKRLEYDKQYMKKQSIAMDIQCLYKTIGVLITRKGAR